MHALVAALALLPLAAPGPTKSAPAKASPSASSRCQQVPVRAVSIRTSKKGLHATAFVAALPDVDRGAVAIETPSALDVVPLANPQKVRLAHFDIGETARLRINVGGKAQTQVFTAVVPAGLDEGTLVAAPNAKSKLRVEVLVRRHAKAARRIVVAVSGEDHVDQLAVTIGSRKPTKVETALRLSGTTKGRSKARVGRGVYYLSFDNGHDTSVKNRWRGSTNAAWTATGAELVGGEACGDGSAKPGRSARTYRRRIKKQMISTLQTYTREL